MKEDGGGWSSLMAEDRGDWRLREKGETLFKGGERRGRRGNVCVVRQQPQNCQFYVSTKHVARTGPHRFIRFTASSSLGN